MVVCAAAALASSARVSAAQRHADQRFPRSRWTVRGQVMWRDEGLLIGIGGRRRILVASHQGELGHDGSVVGFGELQVGAERARLIGQVFVVDLGVLQGGQ
jgi:hypothetical protein